MQRSWMIIILVIIWSTLLSGSLLYGQTNPAFEKVKDDPNLPKVLLIGDSISIGYTVPVRKLLQGVANVHRIPTNGGPTIRGWESIDEWLGDEKWDVIHFNWGLHDLKILADGKHQVPLLYYELMLSRLVQRLKETGAHLIWANTTPVPPGKVTPKRLPGDVPRYNQAAEKIMKENNIAINDLFSFVLPRLDKIQIPVNVHFTEEGYQKLAEKVADSIKEFLQFQR